MHQLRGHVCAVLHCVASRKRAREGARAGQLALSSESIEIASRRRYRRVREPARTWEEFIVVYRRSALRASRRFPPRRSSRSGSHPSVGRRRKRGWKRDATAAAAPVVNIIYSESALALALALARCALVNLIHQSRRRVDLFFNARAARCAPFNSRFRFAHRAADRDASCRLVGGRARARGAARLGRLTLKISTRNDMHERTSERARVTSL